ncbi:MAG: shikimate kinase [Candidatus Omnitrophica bacterium]|nr:shikimate kinase [Candidatus Omnitrophota bacterium]
MTIKRITKNIVLIGLMGSGKTMISRALAKRLRVERFSTDEQVELKEKCSVAEIVAAKGWPYFREVEREIVKTLASKKGVIIDCGGGVVLDAENFDILRKNGIIFHLDANPEVLYQRLKGDQSRPLISGPTPKARIKEIYEERLPLYNQADFTLDASDPSIEGPIVEILKKV